MALSSWEHVETDCSLLSYQSVMNVVSGNAERMPVIFVHAAAPPELCTPLAAHFAADGFTHIYLCNKVGDAEDVVDMIARAVDWLLHTKAPQFERVVLVGMGESSANARLYMLQGGHEHVAFCFLLGGTHEYTLFSMLEDSFYDPYKERVPESIKVMPRLHHTMMVHIIAGLAGGNGYDREPRYLPEAVNVSLALDEDGLLQGGSTYEVIRQCLLGRVWLVTIRLRRLLMRRSEAKQAQHVSGAFCFQINGHPTPFDGVFQVPVDASFDFDPDRVLLGTLARPLGAGGPALDIDFRLKDLSPRDGRRRQLITSLHTPLRDGLVAEHVLIDGFGSALGIEVRCEQPIAAIEYDDEFRV